MEYTQKNKEEIKVKIIKTLSILIFIAFILGCEKEKNLFKEKVLIRRDTKYSKDVEVYRIKYLSDGLEIGGYIIKPKEINGKLPVIIYNRGGNRNFSLVDQNLKHLEYLASNGYIVAASQYRGNIYSEGREEFGGEDINDVLNLINIIKKLSYVDKRNLFMLGISRGGMMNYIASRKTDEINAMAVVCGNTDISQLYEEREDKMKRILEDLIGGDPKEKTKEYKERSAYYWADEINTPVIIFHGEKDWRVDVSQAKKLSEELINYGKDHRLIIYPDVGHSMGYHWAEVDKQILEWFERYKK